MLSSNFVKSWNGTFDDTVAIPVFELKVKNKINFVYSAAMMYTTLGISNRSHLSKANGRSSSYVKIFYFF